MTGTSEIARGPRGRYAKSAEVQDRILTAATEEFASGGYHSVTLKQIAATAGVSERGLVYHFPSKDELLLAVLNRHEQHGVEMFLAPDGAMRLSALLRIIEADAARPGLVELHCLISAETIAADHPAHDRYQHRYAGLRVNLSDAFSGLASHGEVTSTLTPEALAAGLIALMDGLQLQWIRDKDTDVTGTILGYLDGVLAPLTAQRVRDGMKQPDKSESPPAQAKAGQ